MSKHRQLLYGNPVPDSYFNAWQEFISTAAPNFRLTRASDTQVGLPAGADNAQVGIGISGQWRFNTATRLATVSGPAGMYHIYVTASNNKFLVNTEPPPPERDDTDYSFNLVSVPQGTIPLGVDRYRKVGEVLFDGSKIQWLKDLINGTDSSQTLQPGALQLGCWRKVPEGWLMCDGREYRRDLYPELYEALGGSQSPWGQGNGTTTFNVPNFTERFLLAITDPAMFGKTGGLNEVVLTEAQIPSHKHDCGADDPKHTHAVIGTSNTDTEDHQHLVNGNTYPESNDHTHQVNGTTQNESAQHTHSMSGTTGNDTGDHTHSVPAARTGNNLSDHSHTTYVAPSGSIAAAQMGNPHAAHPNGGIYSWNFNTAQTGSQHAGRWAATANDIGWHDAYFPHSHGLSINPGNWPSGGASNGHQHDVPASTTGIQSGRHTHSFSGASGVPSNTHTHQFSTGSGGRDSSHTHQFATTSGGAMSKHTHPISFESRVPTQDHKHPIGLTGGDEPHENRPPFVGVYYCIKT